MKRKKENENSAASNAPKEITTTISEQLLSTTSPLNATPKNGKLPKQRMTRCPLYYLLRILIMLYIFLESVQVLHVMNPILSSTFMF